jgi:hypothetical protein
MGGKYGTLYVKSYNMFQNFGNHQTLYMHLWLIWCFPYIGQCLHIGVFSVSAIHIFVQCPCTRLSWNIKILQEVLGRSNRLLSFYMTRLRRKQKMGAHTDTHTDTQRGRRSHMPPSYFSPTFLKETYASSILSVSVNPSYQLLNA